MTDEVAQLVLNDNYRQNQAISLMERMSVSRLGSKQHFIRTLESQGLLDRRSSSCRAMPNWPSARRAGRA
jgi:glutamate dehydrogenase